MTAAQQQQLRLRPVAGRRLLPLTSCPPPVGAACPSQPAGCAAGSTHHSLQWLGSKGQRHAGCSSGNDLSSRSMAASGLPAHSSEGSPAHAQRQGRFAAARAQQANPCTAAAAGPTREKHKLVLHQLRQHGYVDALKRADNLAWRAVQMAEALRWGRAEKRSVSRHACAACLYGWRMHLHSWCHNCHARKGTGWLAWLTSLLRAASVATASRQAGSCCRHSTPG